MSQYTQDPLAPPTNQIQTGNGHGPTAPLKRIRAAGSPRLAWSLAALMLVVSVALGISSNSISGSRSILQSQLASANGKTGDLQGQVTQLTNQLQLARGDLANAEDQLRIALARQPLPRFIGKDQGEAETMADEVGWHVSITQKESSKPVGTILSQKPESGTIMRYGATFSIVVAKPLPPKMPNLVGKDLKAAKNTASRHDWSFSVKYERTSTAAPGTIIHQTPSPGTYMRGSADFTVTVAKKPLAPPPSTGSDSSSSSSGSTGSSSDCDPNYSGACLDPNASDYDCAGGSGNGPYYVSGPVYVTGSDHYGLDSDGDGVGCES